MHALSRDIVQKLFEFLARDALLYRSGMLVCKLWNAVGQIPSIRDKVQVLLAEKTIYGSLTDHSVDHQVGMKLLDMVADGRVDISQIHMNRKPLRARLFRRYAGYFLECFQDGEFMFDVLCINEEEPMLTVAFAQPEQAVPNWKQEMVDKEEQLATPSVYQKDLENKACVITGDCCLLYICIARPVVYLDSVRKIMAEEQG